MKHTIIGAGLVAATCLLSGCLVGPKYKRPAVNIPPTYRDVESVSAGASQSLKSVGDLKWADVFHDQILNGLIQEALANNYDLRIAAQRVLEQQARAGITRSQSFPSVQVGGSYSAIGLPSGLLGNSFAPRFYGGGFTSNAAWDLDFWGLYRRQNEAERARLLATEWGQRATRSAIVTGVATAYIQLRALDEQLEITHATLASRKESLRLASLRESLGATTMTDVREAEQLYYGAQSAEPRIESQIHQKENDICLLLGRNPGRIPRDTRNIEHLHPDVIPVGLPSQLLERRPDIKQAEAELIAANAQIGVARAMFFPDISLTGMGGTSTSKLKNLFAENSSYWLASGSLTQPIFTAGKLKNNLRLAKASDKELIAKYQQTIAGAFRDVSNALIFYQKSHEDRVSQEKLTVSARESVHLAQLRYENGRSSYLDVLTNNTNLFTAELNLVSVREQEALSLVQLYDALGGGWQ